jgi:predicted TIM-barrel fold metal-dependent hydrolase
VRAPSPRASTTCARAATTCTRESTIWILGGTHRSGFPELADDHWAPIFEACADTDTATTMHVGSSGMLEERSDVGRYERNVLTFPVLSAITCIEWLFSGMASRYPSLKLVLAEGGIGWLPMLMDRVEYALSTPVCRTGPTDAHRRRCSTTTSSSARSTTRPRCR